MKYFIFNNQFLKHYFAVDPETMNTLELVFNGKEAQAIKFVEGKPYCGYGQWKPSTKSEFNRAYVDASTQMQAHLHRTLKTK